MSKRALILAIVLLLTLFLTACSTETSNLDGQIVIWHSWQGAEEGALQKMFDEFRQLHPEVGIAIDFYPEDEIEDAYRVQVSAGLGPDMLIAPADWAADLNSAGAIQEISNYEIDLDQYLSAAADTLRDQEKLYGLPLSLNTSILYYNKQLLEAAPISSSTPEKNSEGGVTPHLRAKEERITDTQTTSLLDQLLTEVGQNDAQSEPLLPPSELDQILEQANAGQLVAMRSDFYGAQWGVQAFGGRLFDEEGRVVLNQGGLANWLSWLKKAQNNSNIILSRNQDELQQLFTTGKATYYIGNTDDLVALQEALGPNVVGVTRLPGRRDKQAGPFLSVEAMMFNRNSTRRSTRLAIQLAEFLTNSEHQRQLVLSAGKLPANSQVNIDSRIEPIVAEFIVQSKSAVPVTLEQFDKVQDLVNKGDELYGQVLGGEIGVGQAATILTTEINKEYGLDTIIANQLENCEVAGSVTLWNTWTDASRDVLLEITDRFNEACSNASLTIVDVEAVELYERYVEAFETEDAPDLFIGNNQLMRRLASEQRLLNLTNSLQPEFLQQFIPTVEQSVLSDGDVVAIPITLNNMTLYINREQVPDPPVSLDDLLILASSDTPVAIPIGFRESYWGISAFGESSASPLLDDEGRLILGEFGLPEWLAWLAEASHQPGIILSTDEAELQTLFLEGRAAMLVSDASQLSTLAGDENENKNEKVSVLPLPSGSPLLEVDSLLFHPLSPPEEREVALKFAQFMSNVEIQTLLMEEAQHVPTNINVSTANYPAISAQVTQADKATVIPNMSQVEAVFEWGDLVYERVLENNFDPATAVEDFTYVVDISNGFEVQMAESTEECSEEGEITLWASFDEIEGAAWQEVISNFGERCANIEITLSQVADFSQQLTATLEATSEITGQVAAPDLFIASHAELERYQEQGLIQDITQVVDEHTLISYLPKTLQAVSVGERLYGLPQAIHLPALYYNSDLVKSPPSTFASLLEQAQEGNKVAMNSDFYKLFWGAAAFGCEPCQAGALFNEQGELALNNENLSAWLAWLQSAKNSQNVTFNSDQAALEQLFLEGQVAYLVADVSFLNKAQVELGVANVGVAALPTGAEEQASTPFMSVDSFFFHSQATQEQVELALNFTAFATSQSSQRLLRQKANYLPTNDLAIVTADEPAITPFISELDTTILLPPQSKREIIENSTLFDIYKSLE